MTITATLPLHERTCRYGHGPLIDEPHRWLMHQFDVKPPPPGLEFMAGEPVYALRLAACPVCGYVELFDPEVIRP